MILFDTLGMAGLGMAIILIVGLTATGIVIMMEAFDSRKE